MTQVFLHWIDTPDGEWQNEHREFSSVPTIGEHVALNTSSAYYRVTLIVHTPFPCDCDAEVYTIRDDTQAEMISRARKG